MRCSVKFCRRQADFSHTVTNVTFVLCATCVMDIQRHFPGQVDGAKPLPRKT